MSIMYRKRILGEGGLVIVHIIKNAGVASITVNGETYTSSTDIEVESGKVINWSATASSGYSLNTSSGTIIATGEEITISPTARIATYTFTLEIGENITNVRITVNYVLKGNYTNSTSFSVNYGDIVGYTVTCKDGYSIPTSINNGKESGNITITGSKTLSLSALKEYQIIAINDLSYRATIYHGYYSTSMPYSITLDPGESGLIMRFHQEGGFVQPYYFTYDNKSVASTYSTTFRDASNHTVYFSNVFK